MMNSAKFKLPLIFKLIKWHIDYLIVDLKAMSLAEREIITILEDTIPAIMEKAGAKGHEIQATARESHKPEVDADVDLVTTADFELQRIILQGLLGTRLKAGRIFAEESTPDLTDQFGGDPAISISIDPINGTERYRDGSNSWEVLLTVTSKDEILYTCSYSPGLGFKIVVDNRNGIMTEGQLPFVGGEQKKVMARWAESLIAEHTQLNTLLGDSQYTLVPKDEPIHEVGGRVGRNIAFVGGRLKGVLMGNPNVWDGLFLAQYARHLKGARVVTFGRDGQFNGKTDLVKLGSFKGGSNNIYAPGGYLVMNP